MKAGRVLVVGSLNADLTVHSERFPRPGETLSGSEAVTSPGGKSANQAAAAAILGSQVALLGAVGQDAHGDLLLAAARGAGVNVDGVLRRPDAATGTAMIVVDAAGENTIIVSAGANGTLRPEDLELGRFSGAAVVCLSLEIPLETVQAAALAGHRAGAQVLLNLSPYREVPDELLALTDVLLANTHEAALLAGVAEPAADWELALQRFAGRGITRAVVTLGGDGAVVLDRSADGQGQNAHAGIPDGGSDRIRRIAPAPAEVVDTTGCGDAFTAGIAHRLASGSTLVEAAAFAAKAGARAATRPGAQSSYDVLRSLRG
ncbi:MAG: ribokinase [Actinomycetota bacterium]|nr:ribokinase [Actinomycetota bacterium]